MAIRVTYEEVLEIMDSDVTVSQKQADAMITAASLTIDKIFESDTTVTEAQLKEFERWLTAHFIASTISRMAREERIGDAGITFTGRWGFRLELTPYGQTLMTMDTTGRLMASGKMRAGIFSIPSFDE